MPVHECICKDGRPGYQWGKRGKKYCYEVGNEQQRKEAKRRAYIQGYAAEARGFTENDYRELTSLLYYDLDELQMNSVIDKLKGFWPGLKSRLSALNEQIWKYTWNNGASSNFDQGLIDAATQVDRVPTIKSLAQEYYDEHGLELVKTLTATDIKLLKDFMRKSENWNIPADQFLNKLGKETWAMSRERARLIYENELHDAYINAMDKYINKEYLPSKPEHVELYETFHHSHMSKKPRPHHLAQDLEQVPYGQQFSQGARPGGINCKCYITYESYDKKLKTWSGAGTQDATYLYGRKRYD